MHIIDEIIKRMAKRGHIYLFVLLVEVHYVFYPLIM